MSLTVFLDARRKYRFNKPLGVCCLKSGLVVVAGELFCLSSADVSASTLCLRCGTARCVDGRYPRLTGSGVRSIILGLCTGADTGNNCIRLLTDTDTSLNGSVVRAPSPDRLQAVSAAPEGRLEANHDSSAHRRANGPAAPARRGTSSSWVASQLVDDDDDDDARDEQGVGDRNGDEHAAAHVTEELAYTRAMLESSDSSDDDAPEPSEEAAAELQHGGAPAAHRSNSEEEAKSAWEVCVWLGRGV